MLSLYNALSIVLSASTVQDNSAAMPFDGRDSNEPIWSTYGQIDGPIVLLGFGSIGRGILPLIERHFIFDRQRFTVIDAASVGKDLAARHG